MPPSNSPPTDSRPHLGVDSGDQEQSERAPLEQCAHSGVRVQRVDPKGQRAAVSTRCLWSHDRSRRAERAVDVLLVLRPALVDRAVRTDRHEGSAKSSTKSAVLPSKAQAVVMDVATAKTAARMTTTGWRFARSIQRTTARRPLGGNARGIRLASHPRALILVALQADRIGPYPPRSLTSPRRKTTLFAEFWRPDFRPVNRGARPTGRLLHGRSERQTPRTPKR